ncbi:MAG: RagB/SusD family nutrient uptake outer membrane protein [Prevotellaceae bacterium]|jgi:hypothetical protein|nr:RagB/SusD family nutrient uptake outer membrane protein [Prevotellaceae bacterium]
MKKQILYIIAMKRINYIRFIVLLSLAGMTGWSCNEFLERNSQNLVIPKTAAQYKEILQYEGYFHHLLKDGTPNGSYLFVNYMTDDVEYFDALKEPGHPSSWNSRTGEDEKVEIYAGCYNWDADIEGSLFSPEVFIYLYKQVMVANICLESVDECDGTKLEKETLRGQAAFTRAFAYFILANIYAKPYASVLNGKTNPSELCVPIKETSTPSVDTYYGRATIGEVWGVITADIQTALDNLKDKGLELNKYEISYPAALVLAMRVALYMEDWDRVIALGEEFRIGFAKFAFYDISGKTTAGPRVLSIDDPTVTEEYHLKFMNSTNTELIWTFAGGGAGYARPDYAVNQTLAPYTASKETVRYLRVSTNNNGENASLIGLYEEGDRRKNYWFYEPKADETQYATFRYDYTPCKFDNDPDYNILQTSFAFRTAEVNLTLAEAYIRQPNTDAAAALALLDELRQARFDPASYAPLSASDYASPEALRQLVWDERRRELCFDELHRWWDLRRTTQPRIKHLWRNNTYYLLDEGDAGYVLNFPKSEITYAGSALIPNIRPNRSPIGE